MSLLHTLTASLLAAQSALAAPAIVSRDTPADFHPSSYQKQFVQCNAIDRSGSQPQNITLKLGYIDVNPTAKKTIVMLHGWPSLWTTYRNQVYTKSVLAERIDELTFALKIQEFGSEYRLIIPEHRGYGDSEHPKDLYSSNTMYDVSKTIQCAHKCLC